MAIVYIVQRKLRFDNALKKYVDYFDYSSANSFGEFKFVLGNADSGMTQQPVILKLRRELKNFNKEDSLMLIGDAPLIAAATVIVAQSNQMEVPILFFERYTKSYYRKIFKF